MEGTYEQIKVQVLTMGSREDGYSIMVMGMDGAELASGEGSTEADAREDTGVLNRRKK